MNTRLLARHIGKTDSTVNDWVRQGVLVPEVRGSGTGGVGHRFGPEAISRAEEIAAAGGIRQWRQGLDGLVGVSEIVGQTPLTYRRLDYWVRVGLLLPVIDAEGSGTQRRFHPDVFAHIDDLLERIDRCPFQHPEVQ